MNEQRVCIPLPIRTEGVVGEFQDFDEDFPLQVTDLCKRIKCLNLKTFNGQKIKVKF